MVIMTIRTTVSRKKRDDVLKTLRIILGPTLVAPGCNYCICYQDIEEKDGLGLIQEWETQADFERYVRLEQFKKILAVMEASRNRPEIKISTVTSTAGLEAIEAIRI
jgi:quinol monooxygenase YgiN